MKWTMAIYQKLGIVGKFGLELPMVDVAEHRLVRSVDEKVRGLEMACLFPAAPAEIRKSWGFDYSAGELGCLSPARAEQAFLHAYNKIEASR